MVVFLRCVSLQPKSGASILPLLKCQPKLMRRFGTVKSCRTFSDMSDDPGGRPASSVDSLVKNLRVRLNFAAPPTPSKGAAAVYKPLNSADNRRKRALGENRESDAAIRKMLQGDVDPTEVVQALWKLAVEGKFPSRRTLVMVAGTCASKGHIEGIQVVSETCEVAYPDEVIWQMFYRHYEAEAHWKRGHYEQALKIFQDLFEMHPLQRRKITNMSAFLVRQVFNIELVELYPRLMDFAEFCLRYDEAVPAANLWRTAFCSASYKANHLAAELLARHGKTILPIVKGKVPAILDDALQMKQLEVIQRLMQFVLNYELGEHYPAVFGAYMDYTCDANDVKLAQEAFYFISKSSIIISPKSLQKFRALLARQERKLPNILLPKLDLNNNVPKPSDYKF